MKKIRCIQLLQLFLFIFFVWEVFNVPLSYAGTFRDDFDSASLDTDVWEITKAGNAEHSIKDGQLFLETPAVEDGIILYFKQKIEGDITVECKMDTSTVGGVRTTVGFTDGIYAPEPSPDFWVHWLAHFNPSTENTQVLVDDYPGKNGWPEAGPKVVFEEAKPHVYKLKVSHGKVTYFIDGEEVGESDAIDQPRYFHISPDTYTSHYSATIAVDYVEITGEEVKAVSSAGKLALTWGMIKRGKDIQ